jgi:hypothetical protein
MGPLEGRKEADVDGFHAGSADGLETEVGVLVSAAKMRRDAEAPSGFEEDIGGGFLVMDVFAGDDGVEEVTDLEVIEDFFDGVAQAAGSDGHGEDKVMGAGDADDGVDGFDLGDEGEVFGFFFAGDGDVIDGNALFLAEHFEDITGRDAAEVIEAISGEAERVAAEDSLPGAPV